MAAAKKKTAKKNAAKAAPAKPAPVKDMEEPELKKELAALRRASKEILDAEVAAQKAEESWKDAKATTSDRKKVYDEAVASLRELVRDAMSGQSRLPY